MAKIAYETKRFRDSSLRVIWQVNEILEEYAAAGYDMTLRR